MNVFSTFPVFIEPPTNDFRAGAELKAIGMSPAVIHGLAVLDANFRTGFKQVSEDKEATDRFIKDFQDETDKFINSMSPKDKQIYDIYKKKYGMDQ
ncbi:hypothetical protein L3Y34_009487 [Caenorhabditis briggsae]|uniref:Uncharacterized protein n=1 Tax=Caenorhabditis briggsae TaxID=6238 RepID=A0AAE9A5F9_CAEBR|nr:hypothetical protein L3Y34_009487 [Caenorhabditis briggsae]